jgi:hypothetical protein
MDTMQDWLQVFGPLISTLILSLSLWADQPIWRTFTDILALQMHQVNYRPLKLYNGFEAERN